MRALPNLSGLALREAVPTGVLSGPEVNEAVHGSILGQIDAMPWEADFCEGLFNYRGVSKATMPSDEAFEQLYAELLRRGTLPMPAGYYTSNVEPKHPLETARSYFLRLCQACSYERKKALDALEKYLTLEEKRTPYGDTALGIAIMLESAKDCNLRSIQDMLEAMLKDTWGLAKNTTPEDIERVVGRPDRYWSDDVDKGLPSVMETTRRDLSPRLYDDASFLRAVKALFDKWNLKDYYEPEEMNWSDRVLDIEYPTEEDSHSD